jgi:hypothetical protein
LTGLRLSPYPSLVIGVEGATEYLIVPRVKPRRATRVADAATRER